MLQKHRSVPVIDDGPRLSDLSDRGQVVIAFRPRSPQRKCLAASSSGGHGSDRSLPRDTKASAT